MKKIIKHLFKTVIAMIVIAAVMSVMSGCCNRTHYDPRMKQVGCGLYEIDCKFCR